MVKREFGGEGWREGHVEGLWVLGKVEVQREGLEELSEQGLGWRRELRVVSFDQC